MVSKTYNISSDKRFHHVIKDPRFKRTSKKKTKVIPDERFSSMLKDEKFIEKCTMDPRGRPHNFSERSDLKRLYDFTEVEDKLDAHHGGEEESISDDNSTQHDNSNIVLDISQDYARGTVMYSDDSSDDDSSTTEEEDDDEFEWGELDRDAIWNSEDVTVEETSRIAVCNMDWDKVKAVDLMVLFSSFLPKNGSLKYANIYLSEYGKESLQIEEKEGPQALFDKSKKDVQSEIKNLENLQEGRCITDDTIDEENEILRKYQRNRLKYYYAVIECDSRATAKFLYRECDRMPFEGAGVMLDLRYIPSDMEFDESPKDTCGALPQSYENPIFQTCALLDSKPTLTWDETDSKRTKTLSDVMTKALKREDYDENLLKNYIGDSSDDDSEVCKGNESDSAEESENEAERIKKFRSLINSINEKENDSLQEQESEDDLKMEDIDKVHAENNSEDEEEEDKHKNLTPFEKFVEKRKQKRKERRLMKKKKEERDSDIEDEETSRKKAADLELLVLDQEEEERHFNMRDIVKQKKDSEKRKKRGKRLLKEIIEEKKNSKLDDFKVNVDDDSRFSALITSGDFAIDPAHPSFKATDAMNKLIDTIQDKHIKETTEIVPNSQRVKDSSLGDLARKVKRKWKKH